jgi:peptide/nickel transport system substrate-binding protein
MRRRVWHSLAAISLLALAARAADRPRYGGTLRIETRASLVSYDPAAAPSFDGADALRDRIAALVFDRLVTIDANGRPRPALAVAWQSDSDQRRWIFELRRGVTLHDGNPLPARLIAAGLAAVHPTWRVSPQSSTAGENLVITTPDPQPNMPAELACARNSIVARDTNGALIGSGPFRVQDWQPGRRATLAANSDYWGGRPFLQSIEITMGRPLRDQALDYRLERVDLIEVSPELTRRAAQEGERIDVSAPVDVLGIVFPPDSDPHLRQALSLAVDRNAIQTAILQRQGEAAGGLLPQWVSGYAFLFPAKAALDRARQERNASGASNVTLAFDAADPLQRAIAERVAVNARDAGVNVQTFSESSVARAPVTAARLGVLRVTSSSAPVALAAVAAVLGRPDGAPLASIGDPEALYAAEKALLAESRFVPLVAYGEGFAVAPRLRNWQLGRDGAWNLADVSVQEAP